MQGFGTPSIFNRSPLSPLPLHPFPVRRKGSKDANLLAARDRKPTFTWREVDFRTACTHNLVHSINLFLADFRTCDLAFTAPALIGILENRKTLIKMHFSKTIESFASFARLHEMCSFWSLGLWRLTFSDQRILVASFYPHKMLVFIQDLIRLSA